MSVILLPVFLLGFSARDWKQLEDSSGAPGYFDRNNLPRQARFQFIRRLLPVRNRLPADRHAFRGAGPVDPARMLIPGSKFRLIALAAAKGGII